MSDATVRSETTTKPTTVPTTDNVPDFINDTCNTSTSSVSTINTSTSSVSTSNTSTSSVSTSNTSTSSVSTGNTATSSVSTSNTATSSVSTGNTATSSVSTSNTATSSVSTIPTPLSIEELNKNWNDLGVRRCPKCKFSTDQEELFNVHTTTCSAVKPTENAETVRFTYTNNRYTCHACGGITWTSQSEFEEHIVIHIQDQPYVCFACKKDFPSRRLIELHVKGDHPDGKARSGLRGIKKGRKCLQELLDNGMIIVSGKLQVPKTPHNQALVTKSSTEDNTIKSVAATSNIVTKTSYALARTSNNVTETSNSLTGTSNTVTETSNSLTGTSNTVTETSKSLTGTSNTVTETSNSLPGTSNTVTETSNSLPGTSNTVTETSNVFAGTLNAVTESLNASVGTSDTVTATSSAVTWNNLTAVSNTTTSNTQAGTSDALTETSTFNAETSNNVAETSNAASESLSTPAETLSIPAEISVTGTTALNTAVETVKTSVETSITLSNTSNTAITTSNSMTETSNTATTTSSTVTTTSSTMTETSNSVAILSNFLAETQYQTMSALNTVPTTSNTLIETSNTLSTATAISSTPSETLNIPAETLNTVTKTQKTPAETSIVLTDTQSRTTEGPDNKVAGKPDVALSNCLTITNFIEKVVDDEARKKRDDVELVDSPATRPMPPPRTSTNIVEPTADIIMYTSKGGSLVPVPPAEQAKNAHLNTLFGELNTSTNTLQTTYVSQKIKNIANPLGTIHHRPTTSSNISVSGTIPSTVVARSSPEKPYYTSHKNIASKPMGLQNFILVPISTPSNVPVAVPVQSAYIPGNQVAVNNLPQPVPVVKQRHILPPATVVTQQPALPATLVVTRQPNSQVTTVNRQQPVSQIQFLPALSNTANRQPVSSFSGVISSTGQIVSNIRTPPPPYPTGSTLIPASTSSSNDIRSQALQNLASLVCPKKQMPLNATMASQTQQILGNPGATTTQSVPLVNAFNSNVTNALPKADETNLKFLFKVSPERGMICEACKKFTKDQSVFRRHVWDHFHGKDLRCGKCSEEKIRLKEVNQCTFVNEIVASLIAQYHLSKKILQQKPVVVNEVIDITDDDNDANNDKQTVQKQQDNTGNDVIMIDDDNGNNLQLQIQSTYSMNAKTDLEKTSIELVNAVESEKSLSTNEVNSPQTYVVNNDIPSYRTNKNPAETDTCKYSVLKTALMKGSTEVVNKSMDEKSKDENVPAPVLDKDNVDDNDNDEYNNDDGENTTVAAKTFLESSLNKPEKDSESAVSKLLESNLNKYNPSKKPSDTASSFESPGSMLSLNAPAAKNTSEPKCDSEKEIVKNNAYKDILAKKSRWAFYVCGYEGCSFTCFLSSKYKEHLQSPQHSKEYNYICGHCGQKDYNEDHHVRHVFTHASSKVFVLYKCPMRQCKYKTNLLHLYIVHLKAHPSEELLIKCNYCNKTFKKIEDLEVHLKQNLLKFIVCPQCSFRFGDRYVVMRHMRLEHPDRLRLVTVSSQIVCNEREINFYVQPSSQVIEPVETVDQLPSGENLDIPALLDKVDNDKADKVGNEESPMDIEVDNEGDVDDLPDVNQSERIKDSDKTSKLSTSSTDSTKMGPKLLLCKYCSYLSYNQAFHNQHLSLHDVERNWAKRFICNLCPLSTDNIIAFRKHISNHVGRNEIKFLFCTSCSYFSNQKCRIMDHVNDAHATPATYTMKPEVIQSNHFECRYCDFKSRTLEQVDTHEKKVHPGESSASTKDTNVLHNDLKEQPSVDGGSTRNDHSYNKDSEKLNKTLKYHCEYCNQFFKHKVNLKEHLYHEHEDIENKQFIFFKCKYCAYTSTMKGKIISHLEKEHNDKGLRILRKIEQIESKSKKKKEDATKTAESMETDAKKTEEIKANVSVKYEAKEEKKTAAEEVVIPDGNTFKQPFKCPKCEFSTSMRLKAMVHLKTHPELKPIRPDMSNVQSKKTARKSSSSSAVSFGKGPSRRGSLLQDIPDGKVTSKNPFTAVKEAVMKDIEEHPDDDSDNQPKEHYILGEQELHSALSACFIPSEQNMNFQCRICKQKIFKKFVLHRHILNHLGIVFFQCRYCEEGSIEKTLMVGHIQKCHPQLPILYSTVGKADLESNFKEKIFKQNFNDIVGLQSENVPVDRGVKDTKKIGIVKKHVLEYQTIEDSDEEGTSSTKENKRKVSPKVIKKVPSSKESKISASVKDYKSDKMSGDIDDDDDNGDEEEKDAGKDPSHSQKKTKGPHKCPQCRYVAAKRIHYSLHLASHKDPNKKYTCSGCDYRGERYAVIKHFYNVYHATRPRAIHDDEKFADTSSIEEGSVEEEGAKPQQEKNIKEGDRSSESPAVKSTEIQKRLEDLKVTKNKAYSYILKTVFKCKVCGEKRDSRTAIYEHFKTSKCNKPMYKCSLCSFFNNVKSAITSHASKRHVGKSWGVVTMPISSKFKIVKIPVRQSLYEDALQVRSVSVESCSSSSSGSVSPVTVLDIDRECQLPCQLCSKYVGNSFVKLQNHINTTHDGVKLKCKVCSYSTPVAQHMFNHCKNVHLQKKVIYESLTTKKQPDLEKNDISTTSEQLEFKCPKCDLKFIKVYSLQNHLGIHFNYKPFRCKYCKFSSLRCDATKLHMKRFHPKKPEKILVKKDAAIETKILKIYENAKNKLMRQKKTLGLSRPSKLDNYTLVEEGIRQGSKNFYCDKCGYAAKWRYIIQNHYSRIHKKRSMERDSDTDSIAPPSKMRKLDDDTASETRDKPQAEDFSNVPLKYKVIKKNGVTKFQCCECHCQTMKVAYMRQHMRRVHDKRMKTAMNVEVIKSPGPRNDIIYKCGYCEYTSKHTVTDIKRHCITHHPSRPTKCIKEKPSRRKRDHADKSVSPSRSPARSSMSTSPSRSSASSSSPARSLTDISVEYPVIPTRRLTGKTVYSCDLCLYSAEGLFQFRLHLLGHEEYTQVTTRMDNEAKMACGFCSYTVRNPFELNIHVASHMGDMRYKCAYCDYAQFTPSKIILHTRYAHSDRTEVIVDLQKKRFTTGPLKLVNFSPVLKLRRTDNKSAGKKKFRRIRMETLESSDSSDDEIKEYLSSNSRNKFRAIESDSSESEEEIPKQSPVPSSVNLKSGKTPVKKLMNIKTSRAASYFKSLDAHRKKIGKESAPLDVKKEAMAVTESAADKKGTKNDLNEAPNVDVMISSDSFECSKNRISSIHEVPSDFTGLSNADLLNDNPSDTGILANMRADSDQNEKVELKSSESNENLPFEQYSDLEKSEQKEVDRVIGKSDAVVSDDDDGYVELSVDKRNELDNETVQGVDDDNNDFSALSETETHIYESETQEFDADEIAKCYDEVDEDPDGNDAADTAECLEEKIKDSVEKDDTCANDKANTNRTVETGIFERISPELFSQIENDKANKEDTEKDEMANKSLSTGNFESGQSKENENVFEKFGSDLEAKSIDNKDDDDMYEGNPNQEFEQMEEEFEQESEGNIFEKFRSDKTIDSNAMTDDESKNSKLEEIEDTATESNIFDKFAYSESSESKKEEEKKKVSDSHEDQNIFDKFNVCTEGNNNTDVRSEKTKDLEEEKKVIPNASSEIDKTPEETADGSDRLLESKRTAKDRTIKPYDQNYDKMEVDELINSIEEAVNEDIANTNSNDTNDMELS
ncbi:hypothetical protein ACF0H5_016976 [Mactra antiquata]